MLLLHLAMQHIGLPHHQVTRELFLKDLGGEMHRTGYLLFFFKNTHSGPVHRVHRVLWFSVFQLSNPLQDWYSELSGGQRSKAELMRQVFLKERCPKASIHRDGGRISARQ